MPVSPRGPAESTVDSYTSSNLVTKPVAKQRQPKPVNKKAAKTDGLKDAKALREAERMVNRQTEKGEVNKYLLCVVDPELGGFRTLFSRVGWFLKYLECSYFFL